LYQLRDVLFAACMHFAWIYMFGSRLCALGREEDRSPSKTAMVGTLSIMLLNMQMLSIVVSFSIEWPTVFNDLFGWLEIFSFNVDGPFSASACFRLQWHGTKVFAWSHVANRNYRYDARHVGLFPIAGEISFPFSWHEA